MDARPVAVLRKAGAAPNGAALKRFDDEGGQIEVAEARPKPALEGAVASAQVERERRRADAANVRAERERERAQ